MQSKRLKAIVNFYFVAWLCRTGDLTLNSLLSHRSDLLTHYEHHYIFYCTREDQPPLILAVFHERMDLMQRLKKRLT